MKKLILRVATAAAALIAGGQAQALTFVLNDTGGAAVGSQARQGFDIATAYWSSVLTDNITVRLNVGYRSLGDGILGQTGSATAGYGVSTIYGALAADATSALDATAVANLRPLGPNANNPSVNSSLTVVANALKAAGTAYIDSATRIDNDGSANNRVLDVNTANAKALGAADTGAADGSVVFSSGINFDFDPTNGIASGFSDFIGVAIHEIGHALGFVSGVDTYDYFTSPGSSEPVGAGALEIYRVASVLDLYRYGSAGTLDWSTQNAAYFSVDGGASQLYGDSRFSTGEFNGDGWQASHWRAPTNANGQNVCGIFLGIMNPYLCNGQAGFVRGLDIAAFDAIGYNVRADIRGNGNYNYSTAQAYRDFAAVTAPVPEPATWAMMLFGFGAMGAMLRRRPSTKVRVRFA